MYKTPDKVLNVLILYQTARDVLVLSQILRNLSYVGLTGGELVHGFPWIVILETSSKLAKRAFNFQITH